METMPTKFFGTDVNRISSVEDAAKAVKAFCQLATPEEVAEAHNELVALATANRAVYDVINKILWSLEFPLGTTEWRNRFSLLNAAL